MSGRMKVGLIGLGFAAWGLKVPSYAGIDELEIVAVADPSPAARDRAREELGVALDDCFEDYRALLERGGIDFVDVSTPHLTHAEILFAAAEAGIPAICDKPLAMSLAEADAVLGSRERTGALGGVHRNFRFFPSWQRVWELLGAGAIGAPTAATIGATGIWAPGTVGDAGNAGWRPTAAVAGGGIVIDYGMHLIYLAREALGGDQPQRVQAVMDRQRLQRGDVEDRATILLDWDDGRHALLDLGWGSGTTGDSTIQGTDGTIKLLHEGGHTAPHNVAEGVAVLRGRADEERHPLEWRRDPFDWYYSGAISGFADAVRGGSGPSVDAPGYADGRLDLEVAFAAYESAATGAPVALPMVASDPVYQRGVLGLRELDLPDTSFVLQRDLYLSGEARE